MPQNRERIYLVGHFAGASEPGVFPIGEASEICNQRKQEKSNQIASTLNANDNKSWVGNFIKVGTFRTHKDGQGFREIESNICPTIPARARTDGSGMPVIQQDYITGYTRDSKGKVISYNRKEIANTLHSSTGSGGNTDQFVSGIRRLTEIECERLQGFPDDWTKFGNYDGKIKEIPKTQRYKLLGNAVTVNVVETIARKLKNN